MPFPDGALDAAALDGVWVAFHRVHEQEYGHHFADSPIEIVNIRLTGVGHMPKIAQPPRPADGTLAAARLKSAPSVFRVNGKLESCDTIFYRRGGLPPDQSFDGPAVVLQKDATTVVPPGWRACLDASANLILTSIRKG